MAVITGRVVSRSGESGDNAVGREYAPKPQPAVIPRETQKQPEEVWTGMDKLVESFEPIEEADASQIASLKEMIKKWYYNHYWY